MMLRSIAIDAYRLLVVLLALSSGASLRATEFEINFEGFTLGDAFPNAGLPTTINSDGIDILLSASGPGANGHITSFTASGVGDKALFLAADLEAELQLPFASQGAFFYYRYSGGTASVEINGESVDILAPPYFGAFFGDGTASVGGVEVHSSGGLPDGARSAKLEGLINTWSLTGQELTIDRIHLSLVPEPSTLVLAIVALFALVCHFGVRRVTP